MDSHQFNSLLNSLSEAAYARSKVEVQEILFELGSINLNGDFIADKVVYKIISLLKEEDFHDAEIAAHLLNFFEFEAPYLTRSQKIYAQEFLNECGHLFTHIHTMQVVSELLTDDYLNVESRD